MTNYNGSGLTPLFHSEISSSYMLYDVFKNHDQIVAEFIQQQFNFLPCKIHVERERSYSKKGSIDLFVEFLNAGKKCALLIEVKVHDYSSAKEGQISTYYNAVVYDGVFDEVYVMYLTQFTAATNFVDVASPKTIDEAEKGKELIKDHFLHISWEQLHDFLANHCAILTEEQKLIVSLHRQWILQKCETDLANNKIDVGERGLEEYFPDVDIDIRSMLPSGKEI